MARCGMTEVTDDAAHRSRLFAVALMILIEHEPAATPATRRAIARVLEHAHRRDACAPATYAQDGVPQQVRVGCEHHTSAADGETDRRWKLTPREPVHRF